MTVDPAIVHAFEQAVGNNIDQPPQGPGNNVDPFEQAVAALYVGDPDPGGYVFNNKGVGYGPAQVYAQGMLTGPKGHPSGSWLTTFANLIRQHDFHTFCVSYKQSPAAMTDMLPMLSVGPEFNATVGSGPAWAFAIPKPALETVEQAQAEKFLSDNFGGRFRNKLRPRFGWVLRSVGGGLDGDFVCIHKDGEETAFISDGFPLDGVLFRATHAADNAHNGRWKRLVDYPNYAAICQQHGRQI
jgi:hypothetical protein